MPGRRSRGDGGLSWDNARQRWVASVTVGYTASGKRIFRRARGRTKTEAQRRLKEIMRDYEDGFGIAPGEYTVEQAVNDWLTYGLTRRAARTVVTSFPHWALANCGILRPPRSIDGWPRRPRRSAPGPYGFCTHA